MKYNVQNSSKNSSQDNKSYSSNSYSSYGRYSYFTKPEDSIFDEPNPHNRYKLDVELLKELCDIQSPSGYEADMQTYIEEWVSRNVEDVSMSMDESGNIYIKKGNASVYPTFVAHMDTVHDFEDYRIIVQYGNILSAYNPCQMEPVGIGGDDRCGIYVCLEALLKFENVKVAFFTEEEIGCVGSKASDTNFFKDSSMILQADRNGNTDWINHTNGISIASREFEDAISTHLQMYEYSLTRGTLTDVGQLLKNGAGCVAANVSCGYYNAHTENEFINLSHLEDAMNLMFRIASVLGTNERWEHEVKQYQPIQSYKFKSTVEKKNLNQEEIEKRWKREEDKYRKYDSWNFPVESDDDWLDYDVYKTTDKKIEEEKTTDFIDPWDQSEDDFIY